MPVRAALEGVSRCSELQLKPTGVPGSQSEVSFAVLDGWRTAVASGRLLTSLPVAEAHRKPTQ